MLVIFIKSYIVIPGLTEIQAKARPGESAFWADFFMEKTDN